MIKFIIQGMKFISNFITQNIYEILKEMSIKVFCLFSVLLLPQITFSQNVQLKLDTIISSHLFVNDRYSKPFIKIDSGKIDIIQYSNHFKPDSIIHLELISQGNQYQQTNLTFNLPENTKKLIKGHL